MSDLVVNPEDRFSHNAAHLSVSLCLWHHAWKSSESLSGIILQSGSGAPIAQLGEHQTLERKATARGAVLCP